MARPAGGGAGTAASGRADGAGALGRTTGPCTEAARDVRAAALGQPRRRGAFPAAEARESNGERAGEVEWITGKLTTSSNRAEKGWRLFVDGRTDLRWRTSMAAGFGGPNSGRVWVRPSSGMGGGGKGRGEGGSGARDRGGVASYGRRGERRHSSARASSSAPLSLRKKTRTGREASRARKQIRRRARRARFAGMLDAWRRRYGRRSR